MTSTKGMSEAELGLLSLRRAGLEPIDRQGRLVVPLGSGFDSQLARGIYPIRQPRPRFESQVLTRGDVLKLYKSVATANLNGWRLNTFVTVSWGLAGLKDPVAAGKAQQALQERLVKWFEYRGAREGDPVPLAGIWVKEFGKVMGLHTHLLMHVPYGWFGLFRRWLMKSVAQMTGSPLVPVRGTDGGQSMYVTDVQDLDRDEGRSRGQGLDMNCYNQWRVFRYMVKGLDPHELGDVISGTRRRQLLAEYADVTKLREQGAVLGQRCGRARSIADKAFKEWRDTYYAVLGKEGGRTGRGGLYYGPAFYRHAELARHLASLGV